MAEHECMQGALLSALLDGEVDADERARLQRHVDECVSCADELASLGRMRSQLRNLPARDLPDGLLEDARRVASERPGPRRRWSDRLAVAGVVAAAVIAGGVVSGVDGRHSTTPVSVDAFEQDVVAVDDEGMPGHAVAIVERPLRVAGEAFVLHPVSWSGPSEGGGSRVEASLEPSAQSPLDSGVDVRSPSWFQRIRDAIVDWWDGFAG